MRLNSRSILSSSPVMGLLASLLTVSACKKDEPAATPPPPPPPEAKADAAPAPPPEEKKPAFEEVTGFATPESVLWVVDGGYYLVSNINGEPAKADDNGFISKLGADGKVTELKWIDGEKKDVKLDAPKGTGIRGGKLYVADISVVRVFDVATGKQEKDIAIKGATFLNDVAVDGDNVYVSDTGVDAAFKPAGTDAVYVIDKAGKVTALLKGADLKGPNGLVVVDGKVWVAPFGDKHIYPIDGGKKGEGIEVPAGMLDGIGVLGDGRVVVSSWESKAIYAGKPEKDAKFEEIVKDAEAPADFTVDTSGKKLLVPMFQGNAVRIYTVGE
jgi:hypothetical protein